MPIDQTIWKIGKEIVKLPEIKLGAEIELEEVLQNKIEILNESWLVIGRQVLTKYNKYIDLLAIDEEGSLILIELKKDKTPREIVAQALDYASWIQSLEPAEISDIFEAFSSKYLNSNQSLDKVFSSKFNIELDEENINNSHQIIIVSAELDSSTERIIKYLSESNVPINTMFFKVVSINNEKYISCAWLIDPDKTLDNASVRVTKEPWNGEFYISFGEGENRNWEDAKKYGFISAGGKAWYSRTLNLLNVNERVWVNIPHVGYVGVGRVIETARKADEVTFNIDGKDINIFNLPLKANYHKSVNDDEDRAEYIVKIKWQKVFDKSKAVKEVGFFGNQNSVCKPTAAKWDHTVDRLKSVWGIK